MADCPYTCFDRVLNLVQKCPSNKIEELKALRPRDKQDADINEILEFGVKNGCFTKSQAQTLYDGIVLWHEDHLDNPHCYIVNPIKKNELFNKMGDSSQTINYWASDFSVTCFEKALGEIKECPEDKLEELYKITTEDGLMDVLDFGVDNQLFDEEQSRTLYEGIIMWEFKDYKVGNYYEEDPDKYDALLSHMGVDFDKLQEWRLAREENEREE